MAGVHVSDATAICVQIVSQSQHIGSQLFAAAFVMGSLIPGIIWGALLVSWRLCKFCLQTKWQHALPVPSNIWVRTPLHVVNKH